MKRFDWARLATVTRKELTDLLRDRKSIFWALFAVAISGPLVLGVMYFAIEAVSDRIKRITAPIHGAAQAPDLVRHLERRGIRIEAVDAGFEEKIAQGELDVVVRIDEHYAEDLAAGRTARITLVLDSSRDRTTPVAQRLSRELRAYAEQIGTERLILRGIAPSVARPLVIEELDLATPAQKSARIFQLMAFYALFAGLMGAIAAALDVTAGERERQTLEPLLATPVAAGELALGKWLAVSLVNLLAITTSLVGFLLALQVVPLARLGLPFEFGLAQFAGFMAVLVPFAFMVPAVLLFFGANGKTAKEAQSSLSMGVSLVGLLPLVSFFRQTQAPWWDVWVPVNGQFSVLTRLLRSEPIAALDWAAMWLGPMALSMLALWAFAKRLTNERLLAGR
ncbi:MAG: ABC transporter permease [Casimicrobiaceae bacterium]